MIRELLKHSPLFLFSLLLLMGACATRISSTEPQKSGSGIQDSVQRASASVVKTRHFVFFVHGVGGAPESFESFPEAIESWVERDNASVDLIPLKLAYNTSSDHLTVYDFSKEIAAQIKAHVEASGGIRSDDQISLIGHSQGCLVNIVWLYRTFKRVDGYNGDYIPNIKNVIALGAPYWGARFVSAVVKAKVAKIFEKDIPLLSKGMQTFGITQLNDLSVASANVLLTRDRLLEEESSSIVSEASSKVRIISIGGVAKDYKGFLLKDDEYYEGDFSVLLPHANLAFLYGHLDLQTTNSDARDFQYPRFNRIGIGEFYVANAIHLGSWSRMPGLVAAKAECVSNPDCKHPTLAMTGTLLNGGVPEVDHELVSKLSSFTVIVNVRGRQGERLQLKDFKFELKPQGVVNKKSGVLIADKVGQSSKAALVRDSNGREAVRFWVMGSRGGTYIGHNGHLTSDGAAYSSRLIVLNWTYKGKTQKPVLIRVNPTHVSFLDVDL